jgi:hypothetical protein
MLFNGTILDGDILPVKLYFDFEENCQADVECEECEKDSGYDPESIVCQDCLERTYETLKTKGYKSIKLIDPNGEEVNII